MASGNFMFKQFDVEQNGVAMKVGTDGVLLGAWSVLDETCRSILDIGTGSGLIALMAAQRTCRQNIEIIGVEKDASAAEQAVINASKSPWSNCLKIVNDDIRLFAVTDKKRYDAIISNPPYFMDSLTPLDERRNMARHALSLSYDELLDAVALLLSESGVFSVILPYAVRSSFVFKAVGMGLEIEKETVVFTKPDSEPKRTLMAFRHYNHASYYKRSNLTIHDSDGNYTDEYKRLTSDFYLRF